jgi:hypothetical protein
MTLCVALVASVVLILCGRWLAQMARAPEFLFAARICSAVKRKPGRRRYWRRIVRDYSLITEVANAGGVVRSVEMRCPHLSNEVLRAFTTERGAEWLEPLGEFKWRVRAQRLVKLGPRYAGIEIGIDYDGKFGALIVAVRRPAAVGAGPGRLAEEPRAQGK